jgi:hypothetical protein
MLALDSLVTDLMFNKGAVIDPETLITAIGGEDVAENRKILDPDMQDPRFEMELSPSMPFRQRGERRLMIIDDSVAPMRKDPRSDLVVPLDLNAEKERLIGMCEALDVRLGRLFALGSWGDAVMVARSARDLRGIALLHWLLDPTLDVDGHKRAGRLSPTEFETKIAAYEKRLDELDEDEIIACMRAARFERRGELLIVDVLEDDGTWDLRRSFALEQSLAALERFSRIPGAPASPRTGKPAPAAPGHTGKTAKTATTAAAATTPGPAVAVAEPPPSAPLSAGEIDGRVVLVFPAERFDLDAAAALGKRDYDAILHRSDPVSGAMRDRIYSEGADFVAPLEFLSEAFVDGKPLARPQFEAGATTLSEGVRSMEVHCPRFGSVALLEVAGRGRFITSVRSDPARVLGLLPL